MGNNYQDTKRRFQKNNNRKNDKPNNIRANLPVFYVEECGSFTTNGTRFDIESIDNILATLNDVNAFRLISYPVLMKKSDVFSDANARGSVTVGYIRNITQNGDIAVQINQKYTEAYKKIKEPTIQVSGFVKEDQLTTILSFNIAEYSTLYDTYMTADEEEEAVTSEESYEEE